MVITRPVLMLLLYSRRKSEVKKKKRSETVKENILKKM